MDDQIAKTLSANDIGITGSHQAGIHVPKRSELLSFFPQLDQSARNPRTTLNVRDRNTGKLWDFQYIYYNNKLFGGTRNEYRLTGMTSYLRSASARPGDLLYFGKDQAGIVEIWLVPESEAVSVEVEPAPIILSGSWTLIISRKGTRRQ